MALSSLLHIIPSIYIFIAIILITTGGPTAPTIFDNLSSPLSKQEPLFTSITFPLLSWNYTISSNKSAFTSEAYTLYLSRICMTEYWDMYYLNGVNQTEFWQECFPILGSSGRIDQGSEVGENFGTGYLPEYLPTIENDSVEEELAPWNFETLNLGATLALYILAATSVTLSSFLSPLAIFSKSRPILGKLGLLVSVVCFSFNHSHPILGHR